MSTGCARVMPPATSPRNYIGPLNPMATSAVSSPLAVAQAWFAAENRRRPQFKQVLQDMEHQGLTEHRARLEREIRDALRGNPIRRRCRRRSSGICS